MQDDESATAAEASPIRSTESANSREGFYLRLIGLSAVRHSSLDHAIRLLISKLASMKSSVGETVMKHQSTERLLGVLKSLTEAPVPADSPLQKPLHDFIKDARKTNKHRNDMIHGLWVFDHLGGGQRAKKMRTTPPADLEQLPDKELDELKQLNRDLDGLIEEVFRLLHRLEE